MNVLVCGGRDFRDRDMLFSAMDGIHAETPVSRVIQGEAMGADLLGKAWAEARGIPTIDEPADWKDMSEPCVRRTGRRGEYNALAGIKRNTRMLGHRPHVVVAFPGGRGTSDMKRQARDAGVKVVEVAPDGTKGEGQ